jgi:hypothetical protein
VHSFGTEKTYLLIITHAERLETCKNQQRFAHKNKLSIAKQARKLKYIVKCVAARAIASLFTAVCHPPRSRIAVI